LITAFDVVEHFGKDEILEVLALIRDRLTPGGRFILQTPNAMSPWAASYRYHDLTHEWIYDPHCITAVLALVGLHEVEIREITPYVHGIPSALRLAAWSVIRAACAVWNLAETGSAGGGVYTRNLMAVAFRPMESISADPRSPSIMESSGLPEAKSAEPTLSSATGDDDCPCICIGMPMKQRR
jgi:hypothetical protein